MGCGSSALGPGVREDRGSYSRFKDGSSPPLALNVRPIKGGAGYSTLHEDDSLSNDGSQTRSASANVRPIEGDADYSTLNEDDSLSSDESQAGAASAPSVIPKNPRVIKAVDIEEVWLNVMDSLEEPGRVTGKTAERLVTKRMGWKTVRIFVSSTFKDFHDEREILVKQVFPDLRAWCETRRLHLVECDLRWGVPKDSTTETTLRVCLGEIDRCYQDNIMPFFINMTSERVGWIPQLSDVPSGVLEEYNWIHGLSVTEMEIMHAAYRKDNPNAIFMVRDPSFIDVIPDEKKGVFVDESEAAPRKLSLLKEKLKERFPDNRVIDYSCDFSGVNPRTGQVELSGLEGLFASSVRDFFKKRIAHQYPEPEVDLDPYLQMREKHESFMKSRQGAVLGRDQIFTQIDDYICGVGQNTPLLLIGGAGSGKSSIMAKMADISHAKAVDGKIPGGGRKGWHVFYHFVGAVPGSTELETMLQRLLKELSDDDFDMPNGLEDTARLAYSSLSNENTRPVIIIVDALNQLDEDEAALLVNWVPRKLAPQIRCIFSMIPDTPQHVALRDREPVPHVIPVTPLDHTSRKLIVEDMLGRYNKRLDDEQMSNLLSKKSSENPLWLSIACEELRVFGSFRHISDKINQLADGLLELEQQVLDRFEKENGGQLLVAALCLLETSATGLLETELLKILGDEETLLPKDKGEKEGKDDGEKEKASNDISPLPAYKWAEIYRALKPFLRPFGDSGEGRLDFYHRSLSKAVRKKYFGGTEVAGQNKTKRWWHQKLSTFFQNLKSNRERQLEEYPYHLIQLGDIERMQLFLTEWDVFDMLYDNEFSSKMLSYWRKVGDKDLSKMEQCFKEKVMNLSNNPDVDKDSLSVRYENVSRLLAQGGRLETALSLAQSALNFEIELGERIERMAEVHWLLGYIADEMMKSVEFMSREQLPRIRGITKHFQDSVDLRRKLDGHKHKNRLGMCLNRLAFYYGEIASIGGDPIMGSVRAREVAMGHIDECIQVFQDLKDETHVADALITKGVCTGASTSQQYKLYQTAKDIVLREHGKYHPLMGRLTINMGIYYEGISDSKAAYEEFREGYDIAKEIFGAHHHRTIRYAKILEEPHYRHVGNYLGYSPIVVED